MNQSQRDTLTARHRNQRERVLLHALTQALGLLETRGYEGIVAKDPESPYAAGRTLKWLKVKQAKYREEARGFYRP